MPGRSEGMNVKERVYTTETQGSGVPDNHEAVFVNETCYGIEICL